MKTMIAVEPMRFTIPDEAWTELYEPIGARLSDALLLAEATKGLLSEAEHVRFRLRAPMIAPEMYLRARQSARSSLDHARIKPLLQLCRSLQEDATRGAQRIVHAPLDLVERLPDLLESAGIPQGLIGSALQPDDIQAYLRGEKTVLVVGPGFLTTGEHATGIYTGAPEAGPALGMTQSIHVLAPILSPRILAELASQGVDLVLHPPEHGLEHEHARAMQSAATAWLEDRLHAGVSLIPIIPYPTPTVHCQWKDLANIGRSLGIKPAANAYVDAKNPILARMHTLELNGFKLDPLRAETVRWLIEHPKEAQSVYAGARVASESPDDLFSAPR